MTNWPVGVYLSMELLMDSLGKLLGLGINSVQIF